MPKSILQANEVEWTKINSIKNFQLIDQGTNRGEKNAKPFKEWLDNYVSDKPAFVSKHLIPTDENIWTENKFDDFTAKRGELILSKLLIYI